MEENQVQDFERYFMINSAKPEKTRRNKNEAEMEGAFDRTAVSIEALPPFDPSPFVSQYDHWDETLKRFPLLFYGLGSKIELLRDFAQEKLVDQGYVVEVDGFSGQPRLIPQAIASLCEIEDTTKKNVDSLNSTLRTLRRYAFIVVHCIDDECMNDKETQKYLMEIAKPRSNIFLVASLDRIPLWSLNFFTSMNFFTIRVDTHRLYSQEIGFTMSSKSAVVLDSIERYDVVLKTLTETARVVFSVLAKHQMKHGTGLTASEWQDKAQAQLLVRMRDSFNTQRNEFIDHKLIAQKKNSDIYTIPLTQQQLEALINRLYPTENK